MNFKRRIGMMINDEIYFFRVEEPPISHRDAEAMKKPTSAVRSWRTRSRMKYH